MKQIDRVMIALNITEKRLFINSDQIFTMKEWQSDIEQSISEDVHRAFCDLKS